MEKVVTSSAIKSAPKEAEDRYYTQIMDYWKNVAAKYGQELKDFVKNNFKLSEEQFDAEVRTQAVMAAKQLLVVRAIAEAEKLEISDEEYQAGLKSYYENSGAAGSVDIAGFEERFGKDRISDLILTDKVGNFLIENGKEAGK